MRKGLFISIEGGEGAGKSTVIKLMVEYAASRNISTVSTREPGGIPIAEKIRGVILDRSHTGMDGRTEALLYAAARRQHLVEKIIPALEAGSLVICDRFIDSSLAYQGHARGIGIEEVMAVNEFAIHGWMPDVTIYMDIDPAIGLARIHTDRMREVNRLDLESAPFHRTIREGYHLLLRKFPDRIISVNADQPISDVFEQVKEILNKCLTRSMEGF